MIIFPVYKHNVACHYGDPWRRGRKHKGSIHDVTSHTGASALMDNVKFMSYVQRLRFLLQGSVPSRDVCTAFSIFFPFARKQACIFQIVIIMMGSYNARLIYPIGYSRRRCGTQGAAVGQPRRSSGSHGHTLTMRNQKYGTEFYGKGSDF